MLNIIPTKLLKLDEVPQESANLERIFDFALTFDPHEIEGKYVHAGNLEYATSSSSIEELRAHLYLEQRRWNHFSQKPDATTETKLRQIIRLLREKLNTSNDSLA